MLPPLTRPSELARFIDPERAERLAKELPSSDGCELALLLGTAFPPFAVTTAEHLTALDGLAREGVRLPRGRLELRERLAAAMSPLDGTDGPVRRLRRAVWSEKARIALRELLPQALGGATIDTTAAELSHLADAVLELTLEEASSAVARRFGPPLREDGSPSQLVVLALGKLGGVELNAGSDIDLLFAYDTDDGAASSSITLHEHWTRVVRRAVGVVDEASEDGRLFRVDLRLRPEGSSGPIVNSLSALDRYYETWGRLWERVALLRARPAAGNLALGAQLAREVTSPFVYRRTVDPALSAAMVELVERSRLELSQAPERDLKLGPGGIREVEFFIQSLQLVWGGKEPPLRVTGTLPALERLRGRGYVSDREHRDLVAALLLLRRTEHRVQWMTGVQTHLLPMQPEDLGRLARTLGLDGAERLRALLEPARERVHAIFSSLAPVAVRAGTRRTTQLAALDAGVGLEPLSEEPLTFGDTQEHLLALARRPDGLLGSLTRDRHPGFAERLLDAIAQSPDPDQSSRYLRAFFARFRFSLPYAASLADDSHAAERLGYVLGGSRFVGDALSARPELIDLILGGAHVPADPAAVLESLLAATPLPARGTVSDEEREEQFLALLRPAKLRFMVATAIADLSGVIELDDARYLLAALAEEIMRRAVELVLGPDGAGFAVLALGRLGGEELGYGSDLDLIFLYDAAVGGIAEDDAPAHYARAAQRVIRLLSVAHEAGPGWEVDTRLRPAGSQGMLATSLAAFARYHGAASAERGAGVVWSGAAWERQALIRARFVAGSQEVGERAKDIARTAAYERGAVPADELHQLRERLRLEVAQERPDRFDFKHGIGGLSDIEFATQWLQMRHGADVRVRHTNTRRALEALHRCGYLPWNQYAPLLDGLTFLRRIEQRKHVLTGSRSSKLETRVPGLEQLARSLRIVDPTWGGARQTLLSAYAQVTTAVRAAYLAVLGLP